MILESPLVQTDPSGQRFIEITPIAIVAVPEPTTFLIFGGALGMLLIATAINRPTKTGRLGRELCITSDCGNRREDRDRLH